LQAKGGRSWRCADRKEPGFGFGQRLKLILPSGLDEQPPASRLQRLTRSLETPLVAGDAEKARRTNPQHPSPHAWLASAYGLKGETDRAIAELAEARRVTLDGRYSSIARLKAVGYFGVPNTRALFEATYFAGLRKAGMEE
jgi:hypothetical protein